MDSFLSFLLFYFVAFVLVFFVGYGAIVYLHELAHQQIYRQFNVDSEIVFGFSSDALVNVVPDAGDWAALGEQDRRFARGLQALSESVFYVAEALYFAVSCLLFLSVVFLGLNSRGD